LETLILFLKGAGIGFVIAAPVGPVGVICVQRTLRHGHIAGLLAGLGAAFGDALYGAVAAFGLTLVSDWLRDHQTAVGAVGSAILLFLGLHMLFAKPRDQHGPIAKTAVEVDPDAGLLQAMGSTFALTVTNPITILSFFSLFALAGTGNLADKHELAAVLVGGVFLGSTIWWAAIAAGAGYFRRYLSNSGSLVVNRISGVMMLCFAAYLIVTLARTFIEGGGVTWPNW
jgi:threonine/homoserine/homoserine lactone efflux protein